MIVAVFKKRPAAIGYTGDRVYLQCPEWVGKVLFWWGNRKGKGA